MTVWQSLTRRKRARADAADAAGDAIVAIAEVARFSAMRRRIGFEAANAVMAVLARRIEAMDGFHVHRTGRTALWLSLRPGDAAPLLAALQAALEAQVVAAGVTFEPEIFIGAVAPLAAPTVEARFEAAAFAVEDAQRSPGRIVFADRVAPADAPASLVQDLRTAVEENALALHYMPKLRLRDEAIVCVEALCRWTHPQHGAIAPSMFVALAEDSGLIGELTLWALGRALADRARLAAEGIALDIDVNLSALLLASDEFCGSVIERLRPASGGIGLEITETGVIQNIDLALANLERMRAAGIRIAIDDFGSGLASLSYLRALPAHELKIDQQFISSLTTSNRDPLLVRSAIDIAHALEMEVTAEGVVDEISLALLRVMRCDHAQGFHISPPLPYADLVRFLRFREAEGVPATAPSIQTLQA